jgi:hypothetical protein
LLTPGIRWQAGVAIIYFPDGGGNTCMMLHGPQACLRSLARPPQLTLTLLQNPANALGRPADAMQCSLTFDQLKMHETRSSSPRTKTCKQLRYWSSLPSPALSLHPLGLRQSSSSITPSKFPALTRSSKWTHFPHRRSRCSTARYCPHCEIFVVICRLHE